MKNNNKDIAGSDSWKKKSQNNVFNIEEYIDVEM